jgi:hypothetical protein
MKVRVIGTINDDVNYEDVIFTQEFDTPVSDFQLKNTTVLYDEIVDINLPDMFPMESTLVVNK